MTDLGDRHLSGPNRTGTPITADESGETGRPAPDPESWDGDQSWWSDELHIPYVPRRVVDDEDRWDEPSPAPSKDDLRYRPAPAGSSRRDRKEWRQAEGERIADLLATVEQPRKAGLRVSAPRGLGRKGRKAFYATRSENVQARRRRQAGNLSEREVGILALVIVIALAVLVRVVFFGDSTPQPAPTDQVAAPVPAAPTLSFSPSSPAVTAAAPVAVPVDPAAVAAATAWFTVTCPLPPSAWAPVQPLMTPAAWAAVNPAPPVVTASWSCTNFNVRAAPDQQAAPQGGVIVRMNADRTITTGTTPTVTENASAVRVVVNSGGRWLIDREPAN